MTPGATHSAIYSFCDAARMIDLKTLMQQSSKQSIRHNGRKGVRNEEPGGTNENHFRSEFSVSVNTSAKGPNVVQLEVIQDSQ